MISQCFIRTISFTRVSRPKQQQENPIKSLLPEDKGVWDIWWEKTHNTNEANWTWMYYVCHHQTTNVSLAGWPSWENEIATILPGELGDDLPLERYLQDLMTSHTGTAQSLELHEKLLSVCEIRNTLVEVVFLMTCPPSLSYVLETQAASAPI